MNFSSASKVWDVINAGWETERTRSLNRVRINESANSAPPLSPEEAAKIGLKINCNWGEFPILCQHGRRQYQNGFNSRTNYFTINIPDAPVDKRADWSAFITRAINRPLRKSREYFELQRNKFASVLLHGIGPQTWFDRESIIPKFVPLEDLRVATDTTIALDNLEWFAIRKYYTEGELAKKVFGTPTNNRGKWDKKSVSNILHAYHEQNWEVGSYTWVDSPEKMYELIKQNLSFYTSDAVPTIPLWHFYHKSDDNKSWVLKVVPDKDAKTQGADETKFLYKSTKPIAEDLSEVLHVQFGDLNNKPPFLYHSVRSLGFLLMEPCYWSNLFTCRLLQHAFESFNVWFRSSDPIDRAKAQQVNLFHKGFLAQGLSIVPNTERHHIDGQTVELSMERIKGLMEQASVAYTQDTESGRSGEETATSVMARVSSVNAMMSGLLNTAFKYEEFSDAEICRRFCIRNTENKMARDFQKACKEFGIPNLWVNAEMWDIAREIPMGSGNPTMEMAQSQALMAVREKFSPTAQQEILHEFAVVVTGDPKKADKWVPLDEKKAVSTATEHAEMAFSTLMFGAPVTMREELNPIDQIETMIGSMAGVISSIERTGNVATAREIEGLTNVEKYTAQLIQILAQNKEEKPRVKEYADALGKLMNTVKGFAQRLQQQQAQNGQNGNGELQAKLQSQVITAQAKAKIKQATAAQNMHHKEIAFQQEQKREDLKTIHDVARKSVLSE